MRKRYSLSFQMEDARHRKAHELLKARSLKQQSEFIVSCILAAEEEHELEGMVYDAVCRALDAKGATTAPVSNSLSNASSYKSGEAPQEMMDFIFSL